MSIHQGVKAEIDARGGMHEECITLGKKLIAEDHYASDEIKLKLNDVTKKRNNVVDKWHEKWEWLTLCTWYLWCCCCDYPSSFLG